MLYHVKEMVLLQYLLGEMSSRELRSIELGEVLLIPLSTDSVWTGFGPHHLNWIQQVQINISGTDSTRKTESLQRDDERTAEENNRCFTLITKETQKVTDVDSQTAVGSFSLRETLMNLQTEADGEMINDYGATGSIKLEKR
jgi:hypothetical protein